jgi:hypothetical protein
MQIENLTKEEKRKFVQEFKGLLKLGDIAKELGISFTLLSYIISAQRTDTCNAIDHCITAINKKLEAIMPQQ